MDITKAMVADEAVGRMKILKIEPEVISDFLQGTLFKSEGYGSLSPLTDEEKELVHDFEKSNSCTVYHVIKNQVGNDTQYSLLFVSSTPDEWAQDKDDLKNRTALAYVLNYTVRYLSEFGSIGVEPIGGGLARSW